MKKLIALLLAAAAAAFAVLCLFPDKLPEELLPASRAVRGWVENVEKLLLPQPEADPEAPECEVLYVIDGDTIILSVSGLETTVRLIGVDAPESVHPDEDKNTPEGQLASQWMKRYLSGRRVTLEYDRELTDRYGRTLAYVYLDGTLIQDSLLLSGMARTLTMEPNTRYQHHFETLEKEAREAGTGFWGTGFFDAAA